MIPVPSEFQPKGQIQYPPHQVGPRMEEYVHQQMFSGRRPNTERRYLPVYWDTYQVINRFGQDIEPLKRWIREIDDGGLYWTVCEYVNGIGDLGPIKDRILVFECANDIEKHSIPIPLLCDPHPANPQGEKSKYIATFVGNHGTHPMRHELIEKFRGYGRFHVAGKTSTDQFRFLMDNSMYALCPRGYGPTSYRIYEAIQMGCVPVYISDKFIKPMDDVIDWSEFCLFVDTNDSNAINRLHEYLLSHGRHIYPAYRDKIEKVKEKFTHGYVFDYIAKRLEMEWLKQS